MIKQVKLTVIVPVYNVQDYLLQCINSILEQSHSDLEIILVNDGSTDNSPQICEELSKKDARIKLIHQTNGGVSAARNTGIAASTGEYITFVDSDDWLDKNMYQKLLNAARDNHKPDVVMCDFTTVRDNNRFNITSNLRAGFYAKKDIIREIYPTLLVTEDFGRLPIVSVWNCLFKKSLFLNDQIRFDEKLRYSEDYLFTAEVMTHCQSYCYVKNFFGYYYRQYNDSRSKKYRPEWWMTLVSLNSKLVQLLSDNKEYDFARQLKLQVIHSALFVSSSIHNNTHLGFAEKITHLNSMFSEPVLRAAFSDLKINKPSVSLRIVLYLMKQRMPHLFLLYLRTLSKLKKIIN